MDVTNHNVRTVMVSGDLVGQSIKGEHNQTPVAAPAAVVPDKPGDPLKVVQTKDTYESQNDLERKKQQKEKDEQNKEQDDEPKSENVQEVAKQKHLNLGHQIDLNA